MKNRAVCVDVFEKDIYGSMIHENKYEADTVIETIDWLEKVLLGIPAEHRKTATIAIDSVGGYEGEHHAEVRISYTRPETDAEMEAREKSKAADAALKEAQELAEFKRLAKKFKAA